MKITVLSSHTGSLFWFRMDMMKEFKKNGHYVIAVGPEPEEEWSGKFSDNGIEYRQVCVQRNGLNPFYDFKTFCDLCFFMRREKPDKVFTYQAKTIIYGSIAAKLNNVDDIYSLVAGLGSVFRGNGIKNRLIKKIIQFQYNVAFNTNKRVFFQNHDDKNEFIKKGIIDEKKTVIINGSGVNINKFSFMPLPDQPTLLFIGRLIKDKGIVEYLEACKLIKENYPATRCLLVGPFDSNPSALKREELEPYIKANIVEYYGEQSDVRPFISQSSIYVLPSYHEGTPKTVLEAMAMGRPIITTDAPGCRETVIEGINGFIVQTKNIEELAKRVELLLQNPALVQEMSRRSLQIAREKYDVRSVNKTIMETMNLM